MASIQWKSSKSASDATQSNVWFSVSIGLIGITIGYGIGAFRSSAPLAAQVPLPTPSSAAAQPQPPTPDQATPVEVAGLRPVDTATEHVRGNPSARVAVIEYGDFECPFCKRVHPTLQKLLQEKGQDLFWVYRTYPLTTIHPHAQPAAEAGECVASLGGNEAFWKFADALFAADSPFEDLASIAAKAGVDSAKFNDCMTKHTFASKVTDAQKGGDAAGVQGTPATFLYDTKTKKAILIGGAYPYESFTAALTNLTK